MLGVGGGLYLIGVARPEICLGLNIFSAIGGQKRVQGVNFGSTNFKRDIARRKRRVCGAQGWLAQSDARHFVLTVSSYQGEAP